MGSVPRRKRRRRASQTSSNSSTIASSDSNFDLEESDSFDGLNSRDGKGEGEEEDEKEEDLPLDYPQEDSNLGRDLDAYKLRSP